MYHHKHLTLEERERILKYLSMGYSIGKIAIEIGRNIFNEDYLPITADAAYRKRRMACRPKKLLDHSILFELVKEKSLCHQWSPEEISDRMRYEESNLSISVTTIYRAIYAGLFD